MRTYEGNADQRAIAGTGPRVSAVTFSMTSKIFTLVSRKAGWLLSCATIGEAK